MIGHTLGNRYTIEALLGQGGMAQVYRATDQVLGRPVAIKILRAEFATDANLVARFQREARAAANLTHPNIVAVHDVGQEGDQHYIVMEYVPGATLKEAIRQRAPLAVEYTLKVAEQVCAALEYAHRRGVIHRDIKPQNILLSEDEEVVKVADFGIAKSRLDPDTTADRLALGTVRYISPEQARGTEVVPQSDLYSLGVVLYEMVTGQQPFDGDTPVSIALQHAESLPTPPRRLNPYLPPAVEGIILRSLAKDHLDRFASAREMRMALERYRLAGAEVTGPIPLPTAPPPLAAVPAEPAARPAYPVPAAADEPAGHGPYIIPRPPAGQPRQSSGLGPLGIALLVLITVGLIGLVVLAVRAVPMLFPTVFPTSPPPTATIPPTLTVPPEVLVPDVRTLSLQEARDRLAQQGLRLVEGQPRFDPYIAPGHVVDQQPSYGTYLPAGSVVTVTLGAQAGAVRIPSVAQMRFELAKLTLEQAGFRVGRQDIGCTSTPIGFVDRQDPPAGRLDLQGITVTVYVSFGDLAVMPEVLRLPWEEAKARLEEAGLVVRYIQPQTQADMPPGVDIDSLGAPGQAISYMVYFSGTSHSSGEVQAGDPVPCRATIDIAYYATTTTPGP